MAASAVVSPKAPASCPANIQETKIAFGFKAQPDIPTENTAAEIWSLTKTNPALATVTPVNETNAADIGKGDEFPSQVFPSNIDASVTVEKYVSSQIMAWLFCFTTGDATKTPAGTGFSYAAVPNDPTQTCINLPVFTYAEQIRTGAEAVVDRALIACVVGQWTLTMQSGPGRANCRLTMTWPSSGRITSPSGLAIPPLTQESFLNAAGARFTLTSGGTTVDYVLNASLMSLEFSWNNNPRLDTGYYPGSGVSNGYAVRGRMEYGLREMTLRFVARAQKGSFEYNALMAGTEGPVSFGVDGAMIDATNKHSFTVTIPRARISAAVNGDDANIVTIDCQVMILKPTDGVTPIITMTAVTDKDAILNL